MKPLPRRRYAAWQQAIANDKIINQFEAVIDDPSGRWIKGDRIIYGVKQVGQQFGYYARNLDQGCDIDGAIAQKTVSSVGSVHKYICRLNSYRALRPGAGTRQMGRQPDIPPEPECCRFHCQDASHPLSLLRREPLLVLPLKHFIWKAYYNVAPLDAQGHFLWIPTSHEQTGAANQLTHWRQSLTPELIEDAVELFRQFSDTVFFFNALHAGASVNHINFQSVSRSQALPIEATSTVDYKGYALTSDYSADAAVFSVDHSPAMLINYIVQLQQLSILPSDDHLVLKMRVSVLSGVVQKLK